jgi:glucokinase
MARDPDVILAGDIGGTSTRLGIVSNAGPGFSRTSDVGSGFSRTSGVVSGSSRTRTFESASLHSLDEAIDQFLDDGRDVIEAACFGVAGPVIDGRATLPNLPWTVDSALLARRLGLPSVPVLNDLEANAYGIATLTTDDLVAVNEARPAAHANAAILSVGTGLGEAGLYWDGAMHRPVASEGGHADFAPRTELEIDLLHELRRSASHVSYERVLSGEGLYRIFTFLNRRAGRAQPEWVIEAARRNAAPAAISKAALEGTCEIAVEALRLFVSCLGAEAGNLALRMMARGGVYLGGGIAPKILPALRDGVFMKVFVDKGRMKGLLESIPVWVIRNDLTALSGAAHVAAMLLRSSPSRSAERLASAIDASASAMSAGL